jgi:NAD(P)-dependent dehydrogenase (short-subunit alcohol dehydrogenase family)
VESIELAQSSPVARLVSARQAARGARVVVADLQSERRAELAEEIGGAFISVDVTNTEQIEAAVNKTANWAHYAS